jgi:hypothetical protein
VRAPASLQGGSIVVRIVAGDDAGGAVSGMRGAIGEIAISMRLGMDWLSCTGVAPGIPLRKGSARRCRRP